MKIIAANFKMNGDREFIDNWFQNFDADTKNFVVIGLPAIYLESSVQNFNKSNFKFNNIIIFLIALFYIIL